MAGPGVSQGSGKAGEGGLVPGNWRLGKDDKGRTAGSRAAGYTGGNSLLEGSPGGTGCRGQSRFARKVRIPCRALPFLE